jgi:hypothetical protein
MRARDKELLPDPFGPIKVWISPDFMFRETPLSICFLSEVT